MALRKKNNTALETSAPSEMNIENESPSQNTLSNAQEEAPQTADASQPTPAQTPVETPAVAVNPVDNSTTEVNGNSNESTPQVAPTPAPANPSPVITPKEAQEQMQGAAMEEQVATRAEYDAFDAKQSAEKTKAEGEQQKNIIKNDGEMSSEDKIAAIKQIDDSIVVADEDAKEAEEAASNLRDSQKKDLASLNNNLNEKQQDDLTQMRRDANTAVGESEKAEYYSTNNMLDKAIDSFLDDGWELSQDKNGVYYFSKDGKQTRLMDIDGSINFAGGGVFKNGELLSPNDPESGVDDRRAVQNINSDKAVLADLRTFLKRNNGVLSTDNLKTWLNFEGGGERLSSAIRSLGGSKFEQAIARTGQLTPRMKRRLKNYLIEEERQQDEAKLAVERMIGEATKPKESDEDVTMVDKDGNQRKGNKDDYNNILDFSNWVKDNYSAEPKDASPERVKEYQRKYKELWGKLSEEFKKAHSDISPDGIQIDGINGEQTLSAFARLFSAYADECPDFGNALSAMGYDVDKDGIPTFDQNLVDDIYSDDDTKFDIEFERRRAIRDQKNRNFANTLSSIMDTVRADAGANVADTTGRQIKERDTIENRYLKALDDYNKNQEQLRKDKIEAAKTNTSVALDLEKLGLKAFETNESVRQAYAKLDLERAKLNEMIQHDASVVEIKKQELKVRSAEAAAEIELRKAQAGEANAKATAIRTYPEEYVGGRNGGSGGTTPQTGTVTVGGRTLKEENGFLVDANGNKYTIIPQDK